MQWTSAPVSSPHPSVPILVGTREAWSAWSGREMDDEAFEQLEGVVGVTEIAGVPRAALPAEEQGAFHVAVSDDEVVLLHWFGSSKKLAARKKRLAGRSDPEYLAGVLEVVDALLLGDAWTAGSNIESLFVVPRRPGRYVVLEGRDEDGEEAGWLRILPGDPASYAARPADEPKAPDPIAIAKDLVHEILTPKVAGKNLVATDTFDKVKRIVALEQTGILDAKRTELASTRPSYARWLGILTRAAKGEDARADLTSLADEWRAPATSAQAPNQELSKAELLAAFDAVGDLAEARAKVESAPAPEVFMAEGDFF